MYRLTLNKCSIHTDKLHAVKLHHHQTGLHIPTSSHRIQIIALQIPPPSAFSLTVAWPLLQPQWKVMVLFWTGPSPSRPTLMTHTQPLLCNISRLRPYFTQYFTEILINAPCHLPLGLLWLPPRLFYPRNPRNRCQSQHLHQVLGSNYTSSHAAPLAPCSPAFPLHNPPHPHRAYFPPRSLLRDSGTHSLYTFALWTRSELSNPPSKRIFLSYLTPYDTLAPNCPIHLICFFVTLCFSCLFCLLLFMQGDLGYQKDTNKQNVLLLFV